MAYEQEDHEMQEQRFQELKESIHKNYRLLMAIGVAIAAGLFTFAIGSPPKLCAWTALVGLLAVEIETIYEAKRR